MIVGRVAENQDKEAKQDLSATSASLRELDDVTGEIVDAAYKIHVALGPGLLESVYETILAAELSRRGLRVDRQRAVPFEFDGMTFEDGFRLDLLVDERVVVELKSVEALAPVCFKQVLTVPEGAQPRGRPADQLRRADHQRGHSPHREQLRARESRGGAETLSNLDGFDVGDRHWRAAHAGRAVPHKKPLSVLCGSA